MSSINNKEELIKTTAQSYNSIADEFSVSRKNLWPDFPVFKKYIKNGVKLLDLGCGNGRLVQLFEGMDIDYLGVDSSEELIKIAQEEFPANKFLVQDALRLELPENSFDTVISIAVLNHLPSRDLQLKFLEQAHKVLKKDGYLLLSNWNLWNLDNIKGVAAFNREKDELSDEEFEAKYQVAKEDLAEKDIVTIWRKKQILYYYAFELEEVEELLRSAGFEVVEALYCREGQKAKKENGANVITIAKKK